jgi:hypothetical protein
MDPVREISETLAQDRASGVYFNPSDPRGDADRCREDAARAVAREAIAADYVPMKIDRIARRSRGITYF